MSEPLIPGGYILLSRKIIESQIWNKPPLYIKVWVYLLTCAQHKDYKGLKRGQIRTSMPEIQEACSWYVGFRKVVPTKDQIYQILEWLRFGCAQGCEHDMKATMIATMKATHGIVITILNYGHYQDSKNYESNDEGNDEKAMKPTRKQRVPDNINKNVNNDNNEKNKEIYIDIFETYTNNPELLQTLNDFLKMRKVIKKEMTERAIKSLLKKLDKFASTDEGKIAILEQSIISNWADIYELKESKSKKSSGLLPHERDLL